MLAAHGADMPLRAQRECQPKPDGVGIRVAEAPQVVAFIKCVEAPVKVAIAASGMPCQFQVVPFPQNGRQAEFRAAMTAIMPELLNP